MTLRVLARHEQKLITPVKGGTSEDLICFRTTAPSIVQKVSVTVAIRKHRKGDTVKNSTEVSACMANKEAAGQKVPSVSIPSIYLALIKPFQVVTEIH